VRGGNDGQDAMSYEGFLHLCDIPGEACCRNASSTDGALVRRAPMRGGTPAGEGQENSEGEQLLEVPPQLTHSVSEGKQRHVRCAVIVKNAGDRRQSGIDPYGYETVSWAIARCLWNLPGTYCRSSASCFPVEFTYPFLVTVFARHRARAHLSMIVTP